jgi:hypothetical protein
LFYQDFSQLSDEEVVALVQAGRTVRHAQRLGCHDRWLCAEDDI